MMKAYINIKNDSELHSHQTLNKWIWLMKRERQHNAIHHSSFGERFDEKMLRAHPSGDQLVMFPIHQFIGFSPLNKSAGKATVVNTAIRGWSEDFRLADRQRKAPIAGEKKKAADNSQHHRRHRRRLLGTKSHSLLGRFLHAPFRSC